MLCFLITFLHYRKSLSPCFWDTTDVKTIETFLFLIQFPHKCLCETLHEGSQPILLLSPTQYQHFKSLCHRSMEIYTVQKSRQRLYGSASNCNIPMNITIGIRLKMDPSGLQQKCISGDFTQLLELPLLRTHIGGCFQCS